MSQPEDITLDPEAVFLDKQVFGQILELFHPELDTGAPLVSPFFLATSMFEVKDKEQEQEMRDEGEEVGDDDEELEEVSGVSYTQRSELARPMSFPRASMALSSSAASRERRLPSRSSRLSKLQAGIGVFSLLMIPQSKRKITQSPRLHFGP